MSDWAHQKEDENTVVAAPSLFVQGFRVGKSAETGDAGILFLVTSAPCDAPDPQNPVMELPVLTFDDSGGVFNILIR